MYDKGPSLDQIKVEGRNEKYKSDEDLYGLFKDAKGNSRIRFLRVATPHNFRMKIIDCISDLINIDNISEIEFLLANPFEAAFLRKLDKELKTNWQIWRIKNQILKFAKGILCISEKLDGCNISIGFHSNDLIWNLGILDDKKVILRSYGKGEKVGHDNSVEELSLTSGESSFLAESFINYYESIKSQPNTVWISSENELKQFIHNNSWPSLFKGNAIRSSKDDVDRGEKEPKNLVAKRCVVKESRKSECGIMKIDRTRRDQCQFFRLPRTHRTREYDWRGKSLVMEKIEGISVFELFKAVNIENVKNKVYNEKISFILGEFIYQSLKALEEFYVICENELKDYYCDYPYSDKLISALNDIKPFLGSLRNLNWDELVKESRELGESLERRSCVPFRDSQLKNRLFQCEENMDDLIKDIIDNKPENIALRIYDIDFESAYFRVTRWDDIIHILLFENVGISLDPENLENREYLDDKGAEVMEIVESWIGPIFDTEKHVIWKNILLRTIREFSRRIWYANVMPNTYYQRYKFERPDYYLNLAILARHNVQGNFTIDELLNLFRENEDLWIKFDEIFCGSPINESSEYIRPQRPPKIHGRVMILGTHGRNVNDSKLRLIQCKLIDQGYDAFLVIDERDRQGERIIDKVSRLANESKFIIIENTWAGGQLYEIPSIENLNLPKIILREKNRAATRMLDDIEEWRDTFKEFKYEGDMEEIIIDGVKWAEKFIFGHSMGCE